MWRSGGSPALAVFTTDSGTIVAGAFGTPLGQSSTTCGSSPKEASDATISDSMMSSREQVTPKLELGNELSEAFDDHCDGVAAAEAEGRDADLIAAALHFVKERGQQAGAAGADRVAECDGAAVDVDAVVRDFELSHARDHLRGERFVDLEQVDVLERELRLDERPPDG